MKLRICRPYEPVPPPPDAYELPIGDAPGHVTAAEVAAAQVNYDDDHSCIDEDEAQEIASERDMASESIACRLRLELTHVVIYRPQTRSYWAYPVSR